MTEETTYGMIRDRYRHDDVTRPMFSDHGCRPNQLAIVDCRHVVIHRRPLNGEHRQMLLDALSATGYFVAGHVGTVKALVRLVNWSCVLKVGLDKGNACVGNESADFHNPHETK